MKDKTTKGTGISDDIHEREITVAICMQIFGGLMTKDKNNPQLPFYAFYIAIAHITNVIALLYGIWHYWNYSEITDISGIIRACGIVRYGNTADQHTFCRNSVEALLKCERIFNLVMWLIKILHNSLCEAVRQWKSVAVTFFVQRQAKPDLASLSNMQKLSAPIEVETINYEIIFHIFLLFGCNL